MQIYLIKKRVAEWHLVGEDECDNALVLASFNAK